MNSSLLIRLAPALLFASAAFAQPGSPPPDAAPKPHFKKNERLKIMDEDGRAGLTKEKVAFLGVETTPVNRTIASQLGLPRDTGLVVRRVADDSPASALLKEHDVLTKLDDQILVDMHQLSVLVRSHKSGDEVKLTLVRGGKETTVKAKLAEREVPVLAGDPFLPGGGEPGNSFFFQQRGMPGIAGMAGPEAADVMRLIGGDRMQWFAQPRVHVLKRGAEKGSTVLDLPSGNFAFSDDEGAVEVASNGGQRELTVKNKEGAVTFQGPLNTPEDHDKLPREVRARLEAIGGAELGDDDEDLQVETRVMEPMTKTRQALPAPTPDSERGLRSL